MNNKRIINASIRKNAKSFLHEAKKNKNDEFYTRKEDIEKELLYYREHFENKVIFMNCDDPEWSEFWFYFSRNFTFLKIKKIISTHYGEESYALIKEKNKETRKIILKGDGDFRSEECIDFLRESDIIVTNPPFSLLREFILLMIKEKKKFLIIGNNNAIGYKEIFPLIMNNKIWIGYNQINWFYKFSKELSHPRNKWVIENEKEEVMTGNGYWFTNLSHKKRNDFLILTEKYKGNEEFYLKYDNLDAIHINKTFQIPLDYEGVMGVPLSFIKNYNPDQFEIIGFRKGADSKDLKINGKTVYIRVLVVKK